ncbi:GGDEF domain-containing protein [Paucibacter sp. TC2R-5]|uniref:diguanylate cyclase n=1 Tax=Paucibacter sp. TC2R-5 TaxID=2893555 RepID=UPI0021E46A1F|nr:GGDEF domain-containing protein [Paucibacter sp. TC2R-5]MCV2361330.1 GGDEF domain-containing protein [Paucibacter sp. TC2R-5]
MSTKADEVQLLGCVRVNDTVSRLGGDEFVMVLSDIDCGSELEGVLRRVLSSLSEPVALQDGAVANVTVSIGVAIFPDDSAEKGILMRKADHAMYVAKSLGKGRVVLAQEDDAAAELQTGSPC